MAFGPIQKNFVILEISFITEQYVGTLYTKSRGLRTDLRQQLQDEVTEQRILLI